MNPIRKNNETSNERKQLIELELKKERNLVLAQEIVLKHLEFAIEFRDSATVAAMAEILKA